MKRTMILVLFFVAAAFTMLSADESFAFSVWFDYPKNGTSCNVEGLKLGLPFAAGKTKMKGGELALCYNEASAMKGVQFALFGANNAKTIRGAQIAFVNFMTDSMDKFGMQWGFYNQAARSGIQIGFINNGEDNALFQLGLININKNGLLPVMIIVNFAKDFFN